MMVLEQLERFFFERDIDLSQTKLLVACSGGVDSMVLIDALLELDAKPHVAHCNFGLRGDESDGDEDFVRQFCEVYDLKFFVRRFNTTEVAKKRKISIQMAARNLRYAFFDSILAEQQCDYLLTAHHLDDSFERFLINLGRGSGARGLGPITADGDSLLRPLLDLRKADIVAYAKAQAVPYREDSSNQKIDYQRNYLRHEVLPKLLESREGYAQGFSNSMQQLEMADAFARAQAEERLKTIALKRSNGQAVLRQALLQIPAYPYLLFHWLYPLGFTDFKALVQATEKPRGQLFYFGTYRLLVAPESLELEEVQAQESKMEAVEVKQDDEYLMVADQSFQFGFGEQMPSGEDLKKSDYAFLDADKLRFPLHLRFWKEGDRFAPYGMPKGTKLLSDFLGELKLNRFKRERQLVLLSGEDIVWVCGYRINRKYALSDRTKTVYFAHILK